MATLERPELYTRGVSGASTMVEETAPSISPLNAALAVLRTGDTTIEAFQLEDARWFAKTTKADIFDVYDGVSVVHRDLGDSELRAHLQSDAAEVREGGRLRIIFLDGDENDAERLPVTRDTMRHIHDTYRITPRFSFYLSRQQHAGSSMHHDPDTDEPGRAEFWYSAVVRTLAQHAPDNSRRVMNWLRCCIWADYDASTGNSTVLATRYPQWMKERFYKDFEGSSAVVLQQHPMLVHAAWMESLGTHQRDINCWFYQPIYEMENKLVGLKTPADLFHITRAVTQVYRQIRQVLTDYEVFLASAKAVRKQNDTIGKLLLARAKSISTSLPSKELQQQLDVCFKQVRKELKLGKTYLTLYLERCNTSIQDANMISGKHSAEMQIQTSTEFTNISRDSKEDNQSLRNIQIMTALFLPPSLISSIFGMGFFSTSRSGNGDADSPVVFSVARHWWWYIAITAPITLLILLLVCREYIAWHPKEKKLYRRRRRSSAVPDLEYGSLRATEVLDPNRLVVPDSSYDHVTTAEALRLKLLAAATIKERPRLEDTLVAKSKNDGKEAP